MDADSCPVKEENVEIARNFEIDVFFVASYNHVPNERVGGTWHFVDSDKEAADLYIMNHARTKDVAVTQRYRFSLNAAIEKSLCYGP